MSEKLLIYTTHLLAFLAGLLVMFIALTYSQDNKNSTNSFDTNPVEVEEHGEGDHLKVDDYI